MLRFEPSIYLDALIRDVIGFGGRILVRGFDSLPDLMSGGMPFTAALIGAGVAYLLLWAVKVGA